MIEDMKATFVVIGDFSKTAKAGKKTKGPDPRLIVLPDHATGDPFRRGKKAIVVKSAVGRTLESLADELKASSRRAEIKIERTGEIDDAYDEGIIHAVGAFDELTGLGGPSGVRKWFARNDSDDYRSGTAERISQIALDVSAAALSMAAADKPAGPHKMALEGVESGHLPEFNRLLRMVDMPPVAITRGDWNEVHLRLAGDMAKVASRVMTGY